MRIETERLIVRSYTPADEADVREYMLQRVDALYEAYPDFTPVKSAKEIAFRCQSDEFFAVELRDEGKVIGNVYFGKRDWNARELGYVLNERYQRRGYGAEACQAVIEAFFRQGLHRVYAECAPGNTASWRLMESLGMRREAHFIQDASFRKDASGKPVYWDTYVYALLNPADVTDARPD